MTPLYAPRPSRPVSESPSQESGQAMLEFAVTLPIVLLMLMGVVYFGKVYYIDQSARQAVRYAAWKASRHGNGDIGAARSVALDSFVVTGDVSLNGTSENSNLDAVGLLTSEVLDGFGDVSSLPSEFDFASTIVNELVAVGLAAVATNYHAELQETWQPSLLNYMGGTRIRRDHYVAYADWPKDEIDGDTILLAFEAVLDAWAYDEITNM